MKIIRIFGGVEFSFELTDDEIRKVVKEQDDKNLREDILATIEEGEWFELEFDLTYKQVVENNLDEILNIIKFQDSKDDEPIKQAIKRFYEKNEL